jgi:hypothetical protein
MEFSLKPLRAISFLAPSFLVVSFWSALRIERQRLDFIVVLSNQNTAALGFARPEPYVSWRETKRNKSALYAIANISKFLFETCFSSTMISQNAKT